MCFVAYILTAAKNGRADNGVAAAGVVKHALKPPGGVRGADSNRRINDISATIILRSGLVPSQNVWRTPPRGAARYGIRRRNSL